MGPKPGFVVSDRYVLGKELSRGGMGRVYRARQVGLERDVALKLILPEHAPSQLARQRFRREARAAARLRHPGVAQVFDFGATDDGTLYLAMELVEGEALDADPRTASQASTLLRRVDSVLATLAYVHARGIIHRDLKPDNIVVPHGATVAQTRILDFGIAAMGEGSPMDTQPDRTLGTPVFMAPEQCTDAQAAGPAADLYSVGVILYRALSGSFPFDSENPVTIMVRKVSEPSPPVAFREGLDLPPGLAKVIDQALQTKPTDRFGSAAEFRKALAPFLGSLGSRTTPSLAATPTTPEGKELEALVDQTRIVSPEVLLVGRSMERRVLERMIVEASEGGTGSMAFIEGPPGVGKSTLADWIGRRALETGRMSLATGAFPELGASGLSGLLPAMESLLNSQGSSRKALEKTLVGILGEEHRDEWTVLLDTARPGPMGTPSKPTEVHSQLAQLFMAQAERHPVLLLLHDLHWARTGGFSFLRILATRLAADPRPMVVVTTLRMDELHGNLPIIEQLAALTTVPGLVAHRIQLQGLTHKETRTLIRRSCPAAEPWAKEIHERTNGTPLFVSLLGQHIAAQESPKLGALEDLPSDLHMVVESNLLSRIERMPHPELALWVLEAVAIAGERIGCSLLDAFHSLDDGEGDLQETVDDLLDMGILTTPSALEQEEELAFPQSLTAAVLLRRMPPRRSRRLHRTYCATLERLPPSPSRSLLIWTHACAGNDPKRAKLYCQEAVTELERQGRFREAADLLTHPLFGPGSQQPALQSKAKAANLLLRGGLLRGARSLYTELLSEAETSRCRATAEIGLARVELAEDKVEGAQDHTRRAEEHLVGCQPQDPLTADLVLVQGELLELTGNHQAFEALGLPLLEWELGSDQKARLLTRLGRLAIHHGRMKDAGDYYDRALALMDSVQDPLLHSRLLRFRSSIHMHHKEDDEARERLDLAESIASRFGFDSERIEVWVRRGELSRQRGDLDSAHDSYSKASKLAGLLHDEINEAVANFNLGLVDLAKGDAGAALRTFESALKGLKGVGLIWAQPVIAMACAVANLRCAHTDKAISYLKTWREASNRSTVIDEDLADLVEEAAAAMVSINESIAEELIVEGSRLALGTGDMERHKRILGLRKLLPQD